MNGVTKSSGVSTPVEVSTSHPTTSDPTYSTPTPTQAESASKVDQAATDTIAATLSLAPHEDSSATSEADSVNIRGMQLGGKSLSFDFSVKVKGHKAPMDSKALGQLAVGCRRSIESVYARKEKSLKQINEKIHQAQESGSRITQKLRRQQKQLQQELKVFDNIKTFDFKVRDGSKDLFPKAVLVIKARDPITHKEITTEVLLDDEFTGKVVIAQRAINILKKELSAKQQALSVKENIPSRIEALRAQTLLFQETSEQHRKLTAEISKLKEEHRNAIKAGGDISQLKEEMHKINSKIAALGDPDSHKIEIVQALKAGTQDFVPVAKVTMSVKIDSEDEEDQFEEVTMNVQNTRYLIHHSGIIKTSPELVQDIQRAAEKALASQTVEGKAFAKKIKASRERAFGRPAVKSNGLASQQAMRDLQQEQSRQLLMEQMRQQQQSRSDITS
ncbi:MAG: hypothetical protein S4CHLAM6_12940 [Chlamydiae bacterium]|nr:hypothetical protein [Chlamydiota bacterium]